MALVLPDCPGFPIEGCLQLFLDQVNGTDSAEAVRDGLITARAFLLAEKEKLNRTIQGAQAGLAAAQARLDKLTADLAKIDVAISKIDAFLESITCAPLQIIRAMLEVIRAELRALIAAISITGLSSYIDQAAALVNTFDCFIEGLDGMIAALGGGA